jgi:hypothetical protein
MRGFATRSAVVLSLAEARHLYCPFSSDLVAAYGGGVSLKKQGWSVQGDGGAATKAAFNLNGGYVEYDLDVSAANIGVIPNVYTVFPSNIGSAFDHDRHYCDAAENGKTWCPEIDWVESNGHCGGAAAIHTVPGAGPGSCNSWGCTAEFKHGSSGKIHMRIDYSAGGRMTISRNGKQLQGFSPAATASDHAVIKQHHERRGAVIYSSQWTGSWVPVESCGTGPGDIGSSRFSVSNLRIYGSVVQGPTPHRCSALEEDVSLEANSSLLV